MGLANSNMVTSGKQQWHNQEISQRWNRNSKYWCKLTFRNAKCGYDSFNQTQHIEGAGTHVGQEEHYANAATELGTERTAYHVWKGLRNNEQQRLKAWPGYSAKQVSWCYGRSSSVGKSQSSCFKRFQKSTAMNYAKPLGAKYTSLLFMEILF